jgi:hypothetical protein
VAIEWLSFPKEMLVVGGAEQLPQWIPAQAGMTAVSNGEGVALAKEVVHRGIVILRISVLPVEKVGGDLLAGAQVQLL